jgi:hypothetical protein
VIADGEGEPALFVGSITSTGTSDSPVNCVPGQDLVAHKILAAPG